MEIYRNNTSLVSYEDLYQLKINIENFLISIKELKKLIVNLINNKEINNPNNYNEYLNKEEVLQDLNQLIIFLDKELERFDKKKFKQFLEFRNEVVIFRNSFENNIQIDFDKLISDLEKILAEIDKEINLFQEVYNDSFKKKENPELIDLFRFLKV